MTSVYVISFATADFKPFQQEMCTSAAKFGISNFLSYDDIWLKSTDFFRENVHIFNQERGFGYWLWKPFIIYESLKTINNGGIVFYIDSGSLVLEDPASLIDIANTNTSGIVSFDCRPLTNNQWTKRETFVIMNLDREEFWFANHVIATVCLFRKNSFVVNFVNEWLQECTKLNSISDNLNKLYPNIEGFIDHRHDQSIFSLLISKYKIETYRNPSKWGNYLKMVKFRVKGELVCFPYLINNNIKDYSEYPLINSPYGTIFLFNRKQNSSVRN